MKLNLATAAALIATSDAFTTILPVIQNDIPNKLNAVDPKDDSKDESITTPISSPPPGYVCEGDICRFVGDNKDKNPDNQLFATEAEDTFVARLETENNNKNSRSK